MDTQEALEHAGGRPLVDFTTSFLALADSLLGPFAAAYVVGSVAAGEADSRVSDLDLLLVTDHAHDADVRVAAGTALADAAARCPLRGVELVLYRSQVLSPPRHPLHYELNVNAGPAMSRHVSIGGDPPFWFLLDVAAAVDLALPLAGSNPASVLQPPAATDVRSALAHALRWHAEHQAATTDAVLNACRSWYWLEHGRWVPKSAAARWAVAAGAPPVVAAARAARAAGEDGPVLDERAVAAFQRQVLELVVAAG